MQEDLELEDLQEPTPELEYIYWHTPYITVIEMYDKYRGLYMTINFTIPKKTRVAYRHHIISGIEREMYQFMPSYMFVEHEDEQEKYIAKFKTGEKDERGKCLQHTTKDTIVHHMYMQCYSDLLGDFTERGVFNGILRCVGSLEKVRPGIHEVIKEEFRAKEYEPFKDRKEKRTRRKRKKPKD